MSAAKNNPTPDGAETALTDTRPLAQEGVLLKRRFTPGASYYHIGFATRVVVLDEEPDERGQIAIRNPFPRPWREFEVIGPLWVDSDLIVEYETKRLESQIEGRFRSNGSDDK